MDVRLGPTAGTRSSLCVRAADAAHIRAGGWHRPQLVCSSSTWEGQVADPAIGRQHASQSVQTGRQFTGKANAHDNPAPPFPNSAAIAAAATAAAAAVILPSTKASAAHLLPAPPSAAAAPWAGSCAATRPAVVGGGSAAGGSVSDLRQAALLHRDSLQDRSP